MSDMNEEDWGRLNGDYAEAMFEQEMHPEEEDVCEGKHHYYLEIGKETPRAKFLITEQHRSTTFGFWVPNSAILKLEDSEAIIADWFKAKIIEFI